MRERVSVRGIVLNASNDILLVKMNSEALFKEGGSVKPFWITPGGGIETDESHREALLRELYEETGVAESDIVEISDKAVWYREVPYKRKDILVLLKENFFLVRVDNPVIHHGHNPDDYEKQQVCDLRWWGVEELRASDELFFPEDMLTLLPPLFYALPHETKTIR